MEISEKPLLRSSLFFLLFIALVGASCSSAEKKRARVEQKQHELDSLALVYDPGKADTRLDAFMQRLHSRSGFNGNVLVAKKGKILYQNTFGWADYLMRDSLEITSQFELASVSKPLTATGILKLVEEGKIKLDQTVDEFFPDFPYPDITLKLLLTHRSGLMNYLYFTDKKEIWADKRKGMTNAQVMELLAKYKPDKYANPDVRFFYNNTNYMVLAAIIEKVTGQDFAVYMKENVFDPAGMKHTAVYSSAVYEKIPTGVVGHDKVWRRSVVQNFQDGPVGDKGIYSTVQDLYLFDRALRDGRLLKPETLDSAYTGHSEPTRSVFNYGYGWRTYESGSDHVVYHTGWWHGFRNIYVRDLTNDVTVVLLANLANGSLLHLDELYHILDMPVIRRGAYSSEGEYMAE